MKKNMLTECEWRNRKYHIRRQPEWVGAQCVYPKSKFRKLKHNRRFQRGLLAAVCFVSFSLCLCSTWRPFEKEPKEIDVWSVQAIQTAKEGTAGTAIPADMQLKPCVFSRQALLDGKMMIIDAQHPLPEEMLTPNTFNIATYGRRLILTSSVRIKTGKETLFALEQLFEQLRAENIEDLYVWAGSTTKEEQQSSRIELLRKLMRENLPAVSFEKALQNTEEPGTGALLLPYAIEIGLFEPSGKLACDQPLHETEQGKRFLDLAWRFGFVPEGEEHPMRFRYVGKAHATAITYLNLSFKAYLRLMHERGRIVINEGGNPAYLIVCVPYDGGDAVFDLPECRHYEAGIDNLGYVLVACTL